eukprot:613534-Rhodomonas_salina.1
MAFVGLSAGGPPPVDLSATTQVPGVTSLGTSLGTGGDLARNLARYREWVRGCLYRWPQKRGRRRKGGRGGGREGGREEREGGGLCCARAVCTGRECVRTAVVGTERKCAGTAVCTGRKCARTAVVGTGRKCAGTADCTKPEYCGSGPT